MLHDRIMPKRLEIYGETSDDIWGGDVSIRRRKRKEG